MSEDFPDALIDEIIGQNEFVHEGGKLREIDWAANNHWSKDQTKAAAIEPRRQVTSIDLELDEIFHLTELERQTEVRFGMTERVLDWLDHMPVRKSVRDVRVVKSPNGTVCTYDCEGRLISCRANGELSEVDIQALRKTCTCKKCQSAA